MKKYYNIYKDNAAYQADGERKALSASTVSEVGKNIVYDGVNVETSVPFMGDAVYHDTENRIHFIKGKTLKKESLPSGYIPVGVCGEHSGSKIYIISGRNSAEKFAEFFRWEISGWNTDGKAHTTSVKLQNVAIGDFTYTATSVADCVKQLDTWLRTNSKKEKRHMAYMEGDRAIMQLVDYNSWSDYNATLSGLTCSTITAEEIPIIPSMTVEYGSNMNGIWNVRRALDYFKDDNSNSAYNPTTEVLSVSGYPICLPAYLGQSKHVNGDKCAYLRKIFGEGREGWENYMSHIVMKLPYSKRMAVGMNGKEATYLLKGKKVPNLDGNLTDLYPAAEYASSIGFEGVKGIGKGDWFGGSASEFVTNARHWSLGTTSKDEDVMNDTLAAMGMSTLTCSTTSWLFSRSSSTLSWIAYSLGLVDSNRFFFYRSRVVPMVLYELGSE